MTAALLAGLADRVVGRGPVFFNLPSLVSGERATLGAGQGQRLLHLVLRRAPWLWPYGGLVLVLGLVMWPAWTTPGLLVIGGDAVLIHYPYQVLWRDALAAGEFPFWNPYTFGGIPAFPTLQAGFGYPAHWLLSWAPAILAMNWLVGLHVVLAGLGAGWCAGRLGASREGQFLSGVAYALGSATVARMQAGHLSFLEANAWLPFATGLAIRIRRPRPAGCLALVISLLALAGQPEVLIFSFWWLPLWALLSTLREGRAPAVRALVLTGLGLGLGVGLAGFQLLPTTALLSISNRQVGMSWDFLTGASLPPWHLLGALAPQVFGDPRQNYWPGQGYEWHERLLYLGLVPLLAAARAPGRWRWACWGAAMIAIALAFGRYAPWYAWGHAVLPGYGSLRIPSKHLTLAALALALAAGIGIQRLHGRMVALVIAIGAGLLGVARLTFGQWFPWLALPLGGAEVLLTPAGRDAAAAIAAPALQGAILVVVLVALAALLPARWAIRTQLALATIELVLVLQPFRIHLTNSQGVVAGADLLRGHERAAVLGNGGALLGNFGPVLQVVQPAGYVSLFSSGYAALVTGNPNPGVAFNLGRQDEAVLRLLGYGIVVDRETSRVAVIQPPPRQAWVARCAWPGGALEVREPSFPRQTCITLASTATRGQIVPPGSATVREKGLGWLVVAAEGPGWLVTTQPWYPGWSASLADGAVPVEVVDGALVGIPLPPGSQTVTLRYRPAGLEAGVLVSLTSALVLVATWWMSRPRRDERFEGRLLTLLHRAGRAK